MRALFERKLPPGTEYYLLFGHGGGGACSGRTTTAR
jgi:hypothetical protein